MGFAETFFGVVGEARRPTLELASSLDVKTLAKPWLVMLWQVIRATTTLLLYARRGAEDTLPSPETETLARFYEAKMDDEAGHSIMLREDLAAVGIGSPSIFPPNPFVAEMVGRQYYLIDFEHPAAYLGYIGLLEGFQPTLEQLDELQRVSGLPHAAFRTARLHAQVDGKHREELAAMLDTVSERLRAPILANALRCAALHNGALAHISKQETSHEHRRLAARSDSNTPPVDDGPGWLGRTAEGSRRV